MLRRCMTVSLPLVLLGTCLAADQAAVNFGGPRHVRASIATADDVFRIEVSMLPVTCFDAVTNTRLSREKARAYALQALAKHLDGGPKVRFLVSGARVVESGLNGKEFRLILAVARAGVTVDRDSSPSKQTAVVAESVQFADAFFTAKRDYQHTLEQLAFGWDAARLSALGKGNDEFESAVARIEEEGVDQLGRLRDEIVGHKFLLFTERDDLLQAIEDQKAGLIEKLKEAVRQHQVLSQFTEVRLEKPFDGYLLAQPLLMEVTGAKIIMLTDGRYAVVGVASTVIKDDSAEDRLRAERVCLSKARAAIIGEQQGVQIAHLEQAKDRTVVVVENCQRAPKHHHSWALHNQPF